MQFGLCNAGQTFQRYMHRRELSSHQYLLQEVWVTSYFCFLTSSRKDIQMALWLIRFEIASLTFCCFFEHFRSWQKSIQKVLMNQAVRNKCGIRNFFENRRKWLWTLNNMPHYVGRHQFRFCLNWHGLSYLQRPQISNVLKS